MDEGSRPTPRSTLFRAAITAFINERKEAKLKGNDEGEGGQAAGKYDYATWLADAARRVAQIQAVTHVLKATHPNARGSSLHVVPQSLHQHAEVGTHVLGEVYADDIVGNAAALDVYKFLKVEVEGRRLLDWLQANDADLLSALSDDEATAHEWASAFKGLIRPASTLASHTMAKQVYWNVSGEPTDNSGFHLLQPLVASSLAHTVHQDINDARFGEASKEARQARREEKLYDGQYRDYRNLVARKLGGTKPQNISQLNSDRGGVNYLLASIPPIWKQNRLRDFLKIETALDRFEHFEDVKEQIKALCNLLKSDPPQTLPTRTARKQIEQALNHSLAAFGVTSRELIEPGWSRHPDCELPLCEQLWLDPGRIDLPLRDDHLDEDQAFIAAFKRNDWPDEVAKRFGQWLNAILRNIGLPVGDVELRDWTKQAIIEADSFMPITGREISNG
ncbi:type I-F CRISPR-associated protein Csy1 [Pseudomonas cichorii]|nr:type I-F CRISPR-associated protein Csy1 [Pseudomonas cichorii]MBX8551542.1 type I-F CRISPR-associated protein Csy1 [Pseudomonas cichorii]MBX8554697.1 type I-F CRISPR-associated protein Csy1 [Pseudomonas cichorii]MBX8563565.1 type I-F CRISPR-associated protein Csy1 [Pseudomonas cichorii]MBX8585989.1 type I-F CRISPR-associated protein Csy1 [Pseudomonas cichorii]